MPKIVIDIFMYIFEALLLYNYADELFLSKKKKYIKILSVAAVNIVLFFIYQIGYSVINGIVLLLLYCFVFCYVYKLKIYNALFHSLLFIGNMAASEWAVIGICTLVYGDINAMHNDMNAYTFVIILSKLIYFSIMMIIKSLIAVRKGKFANDKFFWLLFLLPLGSIIVFIFIYYMTKRFVFSDFASVFVSAVSLILLFENILAFVIYEKSIKNLHELNELKILAAQQDIDKRFYNALEQSQNDIKHFSHDMKNHLVQIRYCEDIKDVHRYVDTLIEEVENITYVGISKNKMLNLIISKYSAVCKKKEIVFNVNIENADLKYLTDVDLATLLNNLLDNAVESAEKTKDAKIDMRIFAKNKNYDCLIIENTCTQLNNVNGKLVSSKEDKHLHGMGIKIINKIARKYDAVFDWRYDSERLIFESSVAFPKTD